MGEGGQALNTKYKMSILNTKFIKDFITHNLNTKEDTNGEKYEEYTPIKYRWTHGSTDLSMGDGLLVYSAIHYLRAKFVYVWEVAEDLFHES